MGAGFFEKARADSETWDLDLATNERELFELSPPAAYVVVGLIKLAKLRFLVLLLAKLILCLLLSRLLARGKATKFSS